MTVSFILPSSNSDNWHKYVSILKQRLENQSDLVNAMQKLESGSISLSALCAAIESYQKEDPRFKFYPEVLPAIQKFALELYDEFIEQESQIPVSKAEEQFTLTLTHKQVRALLACSFFAGLGSKARDVNFRGRLSWKNVFSCSVDSGVERLKCLLCYFFIEFQVEANPEILSSLPNDFNKPITYKRLVQQKEAEPIWSNSDKLIGKITISCEKRIEDFSEADAIVNFANRQLMIGRIDSSATQEEILFSTRPEMLPALLIFYPMETNEAIVISNVKPYSDYTGFQYSFRCKPYKDISSISSLQWVIAIDAYPSFDRSDQFLERNVLRDLNKAYAGFKELGEGKCIATGLWGCGIFGGDYVLKFVQQIMASAESKVQLCFSTFGKVEYEKELKDLLQHIYDSKMTVGDLYISLKSYVQKRFDRPSLSNHIKKSGSSKMHQV